MRKNQARGFTFLQGQGVASLQTQNHLRPLWSKAIVRIWWETPTVTKWVPEPKFLCVEGGNFLYHQQAILGQQQRVQEFKSILTPIYSETASDSRCSPTKLSPTSSWRQLQASCYSCASDLLAADWRFQRPLQLKMPIASCYLYFWPTSYINQTGYKSEVPKTPARPWVWLTC